MTLSKISSLFAMHSRNSLTYLTLRMKSGNSTVSALPTPSKQSNETRPKRPSSPIMRFFNERNGKILSELQKEGGDLWRDMSEEAKRPYVESYEADVKSWKREKAKMKAELEAMEETEKSGEKEKYKYGGNDLFKSEVKIPGGGNLKRANQMWNDLTIEEKEVYNERARKINEKGQKDLLSSAMKKSKGKGGRPATAYTRFFQESFSDRQKNATKEIKREWSELSDEEKENYVKPYEFEYKLYKARLEEYKAGDKYGENKRNIKVLKTKIKQIEEEMNKPKAPIFSIFEMFVNEKTERIKVASEMWQALTEEEQTEYRVKWSKSKADAQRDVAKWEERNANNPKMTELRAYKIMLETAKKEGSY